MASRIVADTTDGYIAASAPTIRAILSEIRRCVRAAVPDATEMISYGMPAFKLDRMFFYYAAFKEHIGIYPPVVGDATLAAELLPYRGVKGNLRFPYADGVPYALIVRVAVALANERGRASAKPRARTQSAARASTPARSARASSESATASKRVTGEPRSRRAP